MVDVLYAEDKEQELVFFTTKRYWDLYGCLCDESNIFEYVDETNEDLNEDELFQEVPNKVSDKFEKILSDHGLWNCQEAIYEKDSDFTDMEPIIEAAKKIGINLIQDEEFTKRMTA